ncbi:type I-D CRISPR-associated protein Cas5/Csc1 [Oxyplasma meridianum]|uniref:Type I-D CRISPR-associated protein Cas5/Csc1 n=1 Tax=Oxyplasma meridianum TaxID=3073602 RepID=A0AAX4NFJ2_9ARCH
MKAYELNLLSPLYYRSRIESGAAGATTTSPWIGDLAMMYAINSSLGLEHIKFGYTSHKPNYGEIVKLGFLLSVLEPISPCKYTKVFDIATSFISEGYPQGKAIHDSSNAPMRNWMKRQGIEPGNRFSFFSFFSDNFRDLPSKFTVRLGNTRESLALVTEIPKNEMKKELTLNLYSLSIALKSERFQEILREIKAGRYSMHIEQVAPQYVLAKEVSVKDALEILEPYA